MAMKRPEWGAEIQFAAATPSLLDARQELMQGDERVEELATGRVADVEYRLCRGQHSLWLIVQLAQGGQVALRPAYSAAGFDEVEHQQEEGTHTVRLLSATGEMHVRIMIPDETRPLLRYTTWLTPSEPLLVPHWPPDVYPVDGEGDSLETRGIIHAAQEGPTSPLLYFSLTEPRGGSVLYFQNATALNAYCAQTRTSPADRIMTEWPEIGFALPPMDEQPLSEGQSTVISDALVCTSPEIPKDDRQAARLFIDMFADIYLNLPQPQTMYRDWVSHVDTMLYDLSTSPDCNMRVDGQRYLRAYVRDEGKPPESMVQLSVLLPVQNYARWSGRTIPLIEGLSTGLAAFYNKELGTIMRWLPGQEQRGIEIHENHTLMDSWYLFHAMLNLSRMALAGDEMARKLFMDSLDYTTRVGQHFGYRFPVFYNVYTLEPIKTETEPGAGGQNDVAGMYALLMLQAREITHEDWYLEEAARAAQTLAGLGFRLGYQYNNVAFSAGALLRLWQETDDPTYLDLSYVCIANLLHNMWVWQCTYGYARHYNTFMGLAPLRRAPYIAIFEEMEAFGAIHEYFAVAKGREEEILPSVRLLLAEYCKHLLGRAWSYYPSRLPHEVLSDVVKDGIIRVDLAAPVEDIYDGWGRAGQVGQKLYGAAAPAMFASEAYHPVMNAPFLIYCEYPIADLTPDPHIDEVDGTNRHATFRILGDARASCRLRVIPIGYGQRLSEVVLHSSRGGEVQTFEGGFSDEGHIEFMLPGDQQVTLEW